MVVPAGGEDGAEATEGGGEPAEDTACSASFTPPTLASVIVVDPPAAVVMVPLGEPATIPPNLRESSIGKFNTVGESSP